MSESLQQLGKDLALACLGVMRTIDTHGPENMAVAAALDRLLAIIDAGLAMGPVVRLDVVDHRLILNGELLRAHGTALEQLAQLVGQLRARRLGGVAFSGPQTAPQLLRWFVVLARRPADDAEMAALHADLAVLADSGIHALEQRTATAPDTEEIVHVSTMAFAMHTYARALLGFRYFVEAVRFGRDPYRNRLDVVRAVQDLVDVVSARADLLFQTMSLAVSRPIGRDYAEIHAANTCVYALVIGHVLELDRSALLDLGTAALLCEVSTALADDPARQDSEAWTAERRAAARGDVARSVRAMLELGDLDDGLMIRAIVAEEHRASPPDGLHLYSRITAAAGAYDALTQRRPWREAMLPADAIRTLAGEAGRRFDRDVLVAMECVLGGYLGLAPAQAS